MKPELIETLTKLEEHFKNPNAEIDKSIIDLLFRERLFKCFLPNELNGLNLSLTETMKIIRETAFINGSLGWLIQIGNGGNYFASCFPETISKELFTPLSAVIAGSGAPSGSAEKTATGYLLSGTWRYCSGADYAGLFTVTFICPESREQLAAILTKGQVEVIRDWRTSGLSQTSTHSICLDQVEVNEKFVFNVMEQLCYLENPVFQMPFVVYAQAFFLQVVLGISARFLNETRKFINYKQRHWTTTFPNRLETCIAHTYRLEEQIHHMTKRIDEMTLSLIESNDAKLLEMNYRTELIFLTKQLRELIHEVYWDLGIEVVYKDHPIHLVYQDFLVCTQHYLLREY